MTHPSPPPTAAPPVGRAPTGFAEFVALIAVQMALTALSIDVMLVALGGIAASYDLVAENDRQLVITAYLAGFALGQPLAGPLSDRFGRKPLIAWGILLYVLGAGLAAVAPSFALLLAARVVQGLGGSAPRIVAMAIVRDRFAGRGMARVMSFVMMVFIFVPIVAPSLGALVLQVAPWRWIFWLLAVIGLATLAWSMLRLPETRPAADRLPLSATALSRAFRAALTTPRTIGYAVASGFMFGALMTYVGSSQQVFMEVFSLSVEAFPIAFGAVASAIAVASVVNARLVGRLGMRRVGHSALLGFAGTSLIFAVLAAPGGPPLWLFMAWLMGCFFCFGLIAPNFNALAMDPMGHIAGMASSVLGFVTTALSAGLGWLAGQAYDGTVVPIALGFAGYSAAALALVLLTERGRLMRCAEDGD